MKILTNMINLIKTKIAGLTAILLLISATTFGQIYFSAGAGYGINKDLLSASNSFGPLTYSGYNDTYSNTYNSYYYSSQGNYSTTTATADKRDVPHAAFGGGLSIGGAIGYGFNEHLSVEIGINYLTGSSMTIEDHSNYISNYTYYYPTYTRYNYENSINNVKFTLKTGGRVRLMPALKISSKPATFTPYVKGGLVVGIGGTINYNEDDGLFYAYTSNNGGNSSSTSSNSYAITATKGFSLGFMAAIGAGYKLSECFSIFGEVGLISEYYAPTHGEVTKYTIGGTDYWAGMSTAQRQFDYTNSTNVTTNSSSILPPGGMVTFSSQYLKQYFSFSSYGLNIGVKFSLPCKAKQ